MEPLEYDEHGKVILPQPDEISSRDKEHAAGAYIMMFASQYLPLPLINLLAALLYHVFCRKRNRFVAFHTYQSLLSQIPTSLFLWGVIAWAVYYMVSFPFLHWGQVFDRNFWIVCGVVIIWNILYMIYSIIAYRRAGRGKLVYLPVFGRLAFNRYFGPDALPATTEERAPAVNRPPGDP